MKKALSILLSLALVAGALAGCGNSTSSAPNSGDSSTSDSAVVTDAGTGTLRLYSKEDIDILNPHTYKSSVTRNFLQMVGGHLYRLFPSEDGASYTILPEYAESDPVQMDEEGKVWTIKVRDDALWSNGEPITAEDFAYGLQMLLDPTLLNHRGTVLEESNIFIRNADRYFTQKSTGETVAWEEVGVKVLENNTLELTLESPASLPFLKYCFATSTTQPIYRGLYEGGMNGEKSETDFGTTAEKFLSSGPYMVRSWVKGTEYTAVKNPNYPLKDQVHLAGINYTIIPESGTAMQMFENGELDFVSLSAAALEQYGEDPRIIEAPSAAATCVGINVINTDNEILQNQKFRQALYFGVNRAEAAKLVNGRPAQFYITSQYVADVETGLAFRETPEAQAILFPDNAYDPEKAKTLFEEALEEAGLTRVTIEIMYPDAGGSRKVVSEYLQSAWPALFGADKLEVKLQAVPSSQLSEKMRDHVNNPNSFQMGWIASLYNQLDPSSALMEWSKDANRKKVPYYDDAFTALYEEIKALPLDDTQNRVAKTAQAEQKLLADAPVIPVFQDVTYALVSDRVTLALQDYNGILEYAWPWAQIAQ